MTRKIWLVIMCGLALISYFSTPALAADTSASPADVQNLLSIGKDDRILGNPNAPITIIEYASMTCPHCAHFADDVLPELKKKWFDTGKVKLVLRDFPLDGEAVKASMIARCAPPDRFYAFIDTFFVDQDKWVPAPDIQAALTRLAVLGGMGKDQVDKCLADKKLEDRILNSRLVASKDLDVNSTPTFFINGTKFAGDPTVEAFSTTLDAASAGTPTATALLSPSQQRLAVPSATASRPVSPTNSEPAATSTASSNPTPAPITSVPGNDGPGAGVPATAKAETMRGPAASAPAGSIFTRLWRWVSGLFGS
jgi:protein-disulfide isomerase